METALNVVNACAKGICSTSINIKTKRSTYSFYEDYSSLLQDGF